LWYNMCVENHILRAKSMNSTKVTHNKPTVHNKAFHGLMCASFIMALTNQVTFANIQTIPTDIIFPQPLTLTSDVSRRLDGVHFVIVVIPIPTP
jgi:hypothetical protein